jgi:hypothetical protein
MIEDPEEDGHIEGFGGQGLCSAKDWQRMEKRRNEIGNSSCTPLNERRVEYGSRDCHSTPRLEATYPYSIPLPLPNPKTNALSHPGTCLPKN